MPSCPSTVWNQRQKGETSLKGERGSLWQPGAAAWGLDEDLILIAQGIHAKVYSLQNEALNHHARLCYCSLVPYLAISQTGHITGVPGLLAKNSTKKETAN